MTDKQMLALAAKAARISDYAARRYWRPLRDDATALQLAQKLAIEIRPSNRSDYGQTAGNVTVSRADLNPMQALRRAIVLAAADIGKAMP